MVLGGKKSNVSIMFLSHMCKSTSDFILSKTVILVVTGKRVLKDLLDKKNSRLEKD